VGIKACEKGVNDIHDGVELNGSANHELFDFANGLCGIESFGANINAIHDGVTSKESVRIF
jgi:hypothetical protein